MKVGDIVKHRDYPDYGKGRILAFYHHQGTVMVKFEKFKTCTYHIPCFIVKK